MAKQLHEKPQDLDLDIQNKIFVEAPDGTVRYMTTEQALGGLRMYDYSITRNLQPGPVPTSFTHYTTTAGLGSNNVNKIYVAGNNVYAATSAGLSISTDGGITYSNYTTANGLGSNTVRNVIANGNNIYIATAGGLTISTDGGATYTNYTTANGLINNDCNGLFYYNGTLYIGYNGATGLSSTSDGGTTITTLNSSTINVWDIYVDGNYVYVACFSSSVGGDLQRSSNGGTTFVNIIAGAITPCSSIFVNGNTIYAARLSYISISTDGGTSWTHKLFVTNTPRTVYYADNKIYVTLRNSTGTGTDGALAISSDGGSTYTNYTKTNGLGSNILYDAKVVGGKIYCALYTYITDNGGVSKSASQWLRIKAGTGTIVEHDAVTSTIDDYVAASGAAGSVASLTQMFRKAVNLVTSFVQFWVSDTTESTTTTNGSFRTAGGVGIVKALNVGGIITGFDDIQYRAQLWSRTTANETIFLINSDDLGNTSINSNYASGGTYRETGYANQIVLGLDGNTVFSAATGSADAGISVQEKCAIDAANSKLRMTNIRLYGALQPTEWRADTHAGYGSTDTMIPYFTNVRVNNIIGSDITVVNNATNGCKITINTAGVYAIKYSAVGESGAAYASGISVNSNQLTTGIQSITASHRVAFSRNSAVAADYDAGDNAITMWLAVNDVVRPHTSGAAPALNPQNIFSIIRIL